MKRTCITILLSFLTLLSFSQAPLAFNYQAVARDAAGNLITNTSINLKITILEDGVNGVEKFAETFTRTTDANGLFSVEIGKGTLLSGNLADIPWGEHTFFLKLWINNTEVGASQLLSVPYALYAGASANDFSGSFNDLEDIPTGVADGDDDTQLTEAEVDAFVDNNGYLADETDPVFSAWDKDYADLNNTPVIIDTIAAALDTFSIDETDPVFLAWDKDYADLSAAPNIKDTIAAVLDTVSTFVRKEASSNECIYRWAAWSTYSQATGWYANNENTVYGGIHPSQWSDGGYSAFSMSPVKDIQMALFNKKGYAGKNANVWAEEWFSYSSTNGRHAGALFRIRNNTGEDIQWTVWWYGTSYGSWGERASVTVNGANTWNSGSSNYGVNNLRSIILTIPANRTSTVIFVAGSTIVNQTRACLLAFTNGCLELPEGLEYVDDLHTAPDGWDY